MTFENYYHEYKDKVYTHVFYRIRGNEDVAADLTADIFLKAYKSFEKYDTSYAFSTWIFTITRNTVVDHFRKERDSSNIEDYVDTLEDNTDLESVLDQSLDLAWLVDEISNLPEKQRLYITLRFVNDYTVKEIAKSHGDTPEAIRKNITRGKKKLIEQYKKNYV